MIIAHLEKPLINYENFKFNLVLRIKIIILPNNQIFLFSYHGFLTVKNKANIYLIKNTI